MIFFSFLSFSSSSPAIKSYTAGRPISVVGLPHAELQIFEQPHKLPCSLSVSHRRTTGSAVETHAVNSAVFHILGKKKNAFFQLPVRLLRDRRVPALYFAHFHPSSLPVPLFFLLHAFNVPRLIILSLFPPWYSPFCGHPALNITQSISLRSSIGLFFERRTQTPPLTEKVNFT